MRKAIITLLLLLLPSLAYAQGPRSRNFYPRLRDINAGAADYTSTGTITGGLITGSSFTDSTLTILAGAITDVDNIQFDLMPGNGVVEGRMLWDDDDGTLHIGLKGGNVNLLVGKDMVLRGKNVTGTGTTIGRPMRISGASGSNPEFSFSEADVSSSAGAIGIFAEDITNNSMGYVITGGTVSNLDTTGDTEDEVWADVDRLYVSNTTGRLTKIRPTGDERAIFIGIILRAHATEGVIWVNPINVSYLRELSGVTITSVADNEVLAYDSAGGIWINQTPAEAGFDGLYLNLDSESTNVTNGAFDLTTTGAINAGAITGTSITDGTTTITGGNYTGVGNITGTDIDISAGTGDYLSDSGDITLTAGGISLAADEQTISFGAGGPFSIGFVGGDAKFNLSSGQYAFMDQNVGIGTTDATVLFHLFSATGGSVVSLIETGDSLGSLAGFKNTGGAWAFGITSTASFVIRDTTNSNTNMFTITTGAPAGFFQIDGSTARVSIGRDDDKTPDALLELSMGGEADDYFMLSSAKANDGDILIVDNLGNFGFNQPSPSARIDIEDATTASNTSRTVVEINHDHSGNTTATTTTEGIKIISLIEGTDTTVGTGKTSYGINIDYDDNSTLNNAGLDHMSGGMTINARFGGTLTDASSFLLDGIAITTRGNMGTTGQTSKSGVAVVVLETADDNFGFWAAVSGGTNNWAFYNAAGDMHMGSDNSLSTWGDGQEASIQYNSDSDMVFTTSGGEFVFNGANVGIGKSTGINTTLDVNGDISVGGSNNELRWYEGANYIGFEAPALSGNQIWVLPATDGDAGAVLTTDGSGTTSWTDNASEKSWPFMSRDASSGTNYIGGFYKFGATDNDFNPVINFGTANVSYAAHFFLVQAAGASGGVDTIIRVSGTTIDDNGTRVTGVNVDITVDDAGAAGTYYETTEKWLGQVTIVVLSGPDLLMNYGFCKYWDNNNTDFRVAGIEATWLGAKNDANPDIHLHHHRPTGWTYNAGAEPTTPTEIASMNGDHVAEIEIAIDQEGAWKRSNLSTNIMGSSNEGTIFELTTTTIRTYAIGSFMIRITPQ